MKYVGIFSKVIGWAARLSTKAKIVSMTVAGTILFGAGMGIGVAVGGLDDNEHTHVYIQTVTSATCEESGLQTYTCGCGDVYTEALPALGHDTVTHDAKAATCTEIGWNEYVACQRNGCLYTTYCELPAFGHDTVAHEPQAPTCTQVGWNAYETCQCTGCEYTTYAEIPALQHDKVQHNARAATCTEKGWDAYEACTRCSYTTYAEIPALQHDRVQHNAQAATCTEKGWDAYEACTRCSYTSYAEILAFGHELVHHEGRAATCLAIGWGEYDTCSRCNHTTYAPISALGHSALDATVENLVDADCENDGWYDSVVYCGRCEKEMSRERKAVSAKGHTIAEPAVENRVEPDCVLDGWYDIVGYCSVCFGEMARQTIVVPALGHDIVAHDGKAATCLADGWEAYETCDRCEYTSYKTVFALGHDYIFHEGKDATCLAIGWGEYNTCSRCDYNEYEEIPALGHNHVLNEARMATCTEVGWEAYTACSRCPYTERVEIPALGHKVFQSVEQKLVNYTVRNDAEYPFGVSGNQLTSTNKVGNSSSTYTITACRAFVLQLEYKVSSESFYDELIIKYNSILKVKASGTKATEFTAFTIPMSYGDVVTITYSKDAQVNAGSDCAWVNILTEPTSMVAVEVGVSATQENIASLISCSEEVCCVVCSAVLADTIEHTYSSYEAKAPTCTEVGQRVYTCSVCGYTTDEAIPALGHEYISHPAKRVTCVEVGWDAYQTCARCPYTSFMEIPMRHNAEGNNGLCWGCGRVESSAGLLYSQNADGTYSVTGIGTCTEENVIIGTYNGKEVTAIGALAFRGYTALKTIALPDSIKTIGDSAFFGCTGLTSITLPDGVTSIGVSAFKNCSGLTEMVVPSSVTSIGASAFYGCSALENVTLPKGLTAIGSATFYGCSALTGVVIPEGVSIVGASAFYGCTRLQWVVIPESVQSIGYMAFFGCSGLGDVYYEGAASKWTDISMNVANTALIDARRYDYSETEPELNVDGTAYDGDYWRYGANGQPVVWLYIEPEE